MQTHCRCQGPRAIPVLLERVTVLHTSLLRDLYQPPNTSLLCSVSLEEGYWRKGMLPYAPSFTLNQNYSFAYDGCEIQSNGVCIEAKWRRALGLLTSESRSICKEGGRVSEVSDSLLLLGVVGVDVNGCFGERDGTFGERDGTDWAFLAFCKSLQREQVKTKELVVRGNMIMIYWTIRTSQIQYNAKYNWADN